MHFEHTSESTLYPAETAGSCDRFRNRQLFSLMFSSQVPKGAKNPTPNANPNPNGNANPNANPNANANANANGKEKGAGMGMGTENSKEVIPR